jgi:hypothetical protein
VLLLRLLLGVEPNAELGELQATAPAPEWAAGLRLEGVRALGRSWDVLVGEDGDVAVSAA